MQTRARTEYRSNRRIVVTDYASPSLPQGPEACRRDRVRCTRACGRSETYAGFPIDAPEGGRRAIAGPACPAAATARAPG